MDIEGAEAVVFGRNFESWIDKVDNIAIELHADSPFGDAHKAFFSAQKGRDLQIKEAGELTLCLKYYHPPLSHGRVRQFALSGDS